LKSAWLVARTVLTEAVRRREIYAIVLLTVLLIGAVMTVTFFKIEGLTKFYREIALKLMSIATAVTTVVLAARQLPREFSNRTIYPLLARPLSRWKFLTGKLLGVMLASLFCLALFLAVFVVGSLFLKASLPWALLAQFVYLQMIMMLILATLSFWLSLMFNLDAAITTGILFFATSSIITTATSYIYDFTSGFGRGMLLVLNYLLPQLTLFDLSAKAVHAEAWGPLGANIVTQLTLYGLIFAALYWSLALLWFRRKPL
jgi:Cu-processing system permease protein